VSNEGEFWQKWLDICARKKRDGFVSLTQHERMFYAMNLLKGTVDRGGFHPYFDTASREEVELAAAGFSEHGAPEIALLVSTAALILFPEGIPDTLAEQQRQLPSWTDEEIDADTEPAWSSQIEALNRHFYTLSHLAYGTVEAYFDKHVKSG
jgi:hypothetical protein